MSLELSRVASDYIGVPFVEHGRTPEGWDCYGLVYYLSRRYLHLNVPSYSLSYTDCDHADDAFAEHVGEWHGVQLADMQPGDVVVLNVEGLPTHCGLLLGDAGMLHCMHGRDTVRERIDSWHWSHRIAGAYRWT